MKKYFLGLMAIVFAVASSAFTVSEKSSATNFDPMLHFFNGTNYLGQRTLSAQEVLCPGAGILCAKGYEEIDEETETPIVNTWVADAQKAQ
ncbi:MAG: hypothetical protein H0V30_05990 [Chitinophagaceae bacterium]|nr:hypothetical protein [Chitinophagaceae bacterium]